MYEDFFKTRLTHHRHCIVSLADRVITHQPRKEIKIVKSLETERKRFELIYKVHRQKYLVLNNS